VTDADGKKLEEVKRKISTQWVVALKVPVDDVNWLVRQFESAQAELNLVADCLEGNAPMHLAFVDHPHAHNARSLQSQLTAANALAEKLAHTVNIERAKVEKLREALLPFADETAFTILTSSSCSVSGETLKKARQALTDTEEK